MEEKIAHINLYIKDSWKQKLAQIAREKSAAEKRDISLLILIKESLNNLYSLEEKK